MKNKYQRLTKEEKKECRNMYYNTKKGKEMHLRFMRLNVIGAMGLIICAYFMGNGIINNQLKWYDYCILIPLLIASIVFITGTIYLKIKVFNQFAITIPRFKNK